MRMSARHHVKYLLYGKRYDKFCSSVLIFCTQKRKKECRIQVRRKLYLSSKSKNEDDKVIPGLHYLMILLQKVAYEIFFFEEVHETKSSILEYAENELLVYVFESINGGANELVKRNILNLYNEIFSDMPLEKYRSLLDNFDSIIRIVREVIDEF